MCLFGFCDVDDSVEDIIGEESFVKSVLCEMSSLASLSYKQELTIYGYLRKYGKEYEILIPVDLNLVILSFYQQTYIVLGIGDDTYNQLDLKETNEYKWYKLEEFSRVCQNPNHISVANENYFIHNQTELYAIGNNHDGSLGIDKSELIEVECFTKVIFQDPEIQTNNSYTIDIISKGINSDHSFIVFKNKTDDTQLFYAFGNNHTDQQGYASKDAKKHCNYAPVRISALNQLFHNMKIKQITTGSGHSLFLKNMVVFIAVEIMQLVNVQSPKKKRRLLNPFKFRYYLILLKYLLVMNITCA